MTKEGGPSIAFVPESPDENEKAKNIGVMRAMERARVEGFKVGQVVAHISEPLTHELKEINGDTVVLWLPGKPETVKELPLEGLFDPNVALEESFQAKAEIAFGQDEKKH